jgi:predicted GNAT family acetyltransferase
MAPRNFRQDPPARRYLLEVGGVQVGFVDYDPVGEDAVLIKHTEVARDFEGQGHGTALVRHVLEEVRAQGKHVIPICPYTRDFIRRHPEYLGVVREDYRAALR